MDQASYIFSQTVKDTDQGSIHIQKRTDKGHGADVNSCSGTVKKKIAKKRTEKKNPAAQKAPRSMQPVHAFPVIWRILLRKPRACISATDGISITETEFVTVDGKRIRGRAIPVNTP